MIGPKESKMYAILWVAIVDSYELLYATCLLGAIGIIFQG